MIQVWKSVPDAAGISILPGISFTTIATEAGGRSPLEVAVFELAADATQNIETSAMGSTQVAED